MQDATSKSLLTRIRNADDTSSWKTFVAIYEPFIEGYLKRQGVSRDIALDVRQEVLIVVCRKVASFQHNGRRGAFRYWLRKITVNCLLAYVRKHKGESPGGSAFADIIDQLSDDDSEQSRVWDREHNRHVLHALLAQVEPHFQPNSLLAFRKTALEQISPEDVAMELGMTRNAVIVARCKVLGKLREFAGEFLD